MHRHPIEIYREKQGLSRDRLGHKLGVTGMTVYRWERRQCLPLRKDWHKIEKLTGIEPQELLANAPKPKQL